MAGCLFEVSLPEEEGWRWAGGGGEVTLVAEEVRSDRRHFRFRAEAAGTPHGTVELRFERGDEQRLVPVHVAPERAPED